MKEATGIEARSATAEPLNGGILRASRAIFHSVRADIQAALTMAREDIALILAGIEARLKRLF